MSNKYYFVQKQTYIFGTPEEEKETYINGTEGVCQAW